MVDDSIEELSSRSSSRLVLVEPIPIFASDPLTCLSGASTADQCTFPPILSTVEEDLYRDAAARSDTATSIDLDGLACPRLPICDPLQRDYPVWRDSNHFTTQFSSSLGPVIDQQLAAAGVFDLVADDD